MHVGCRIMEPSARGILRVATSSGAAPDDDGSRKSAVEAPSLFQRSRRISRKKEGKSCMDWIYGTSDLKRCVSKHQRLMIYRSLSPTSARVNVLRTYGFDLFSFAHNSRPEVLAMTLFLH